ncbi:multiple epidermal growth factor-like domains protein 10 isoform X2 [Ptychodera flava]|uniref:multiple epidermal growth factor-like domains protein 10 isoform X2 n=1 Tax=Ptychodera flava TaxID=63121 RepID=UPI00396A45A2
MIVTPNMAGLRALSLLMGVALVGCVSPNGPNVCKHAYVPSEFGTVSASAHVSVEYVCCNGWLEANDGTCTIACSDVSPGTYGPYCSLDCLCLNGGSCDPVNGSCTCSPGWKGQFCQNQCNDDDYGPGCNLDCPNCQNGGICHHVTGECICPVGFRGEKCTTECSSSAVNCNDPCTRCQNGATCDPASTLCLCLDGWEGQYCEDACDGDDYGFLCEEKCNCRNQAVCDPITGSCLCQPGYHGNRCQNRCPEGLYGDQCGYVCVCLNGATCDHVTGNCNCLQGWQGVYCHVCGDGFWGDNCDNVCLCNTPCDPTTGECGAVQPTLAQTEPPVITDPFQFSTTQPQQFYTTAQAPTTSAQGTNEITTAIQAGSAPQSSSSSLIVPVLAGVSAVLVIALIIAIVVICMFKRKQNSPKSDGPTPPPRNDPPKDGNENAAYYSSLDGSQYSRYATYQASPEGVHLDVPETPPYIQIYDNNGPPSRPPPATPTQPRPPKGGKIDLNTPVPIGANRALPTAPSGETAEGIYETLPGDGQYEYAYAVQPTNEGMRYMSLSEQNRGKNQYTSLNADTRK